MGWLKKPNQIKSCEKSSWIIFHLELVVYFPLAVCFSFNQAQTEKQAAERRKKTSKCRLFIEISTKRSDEQSSNRGHRASVRWRAVFAFCSSGLRALDVKQVAGYWLALSPSEALPVDMRSQLEMRVKFEPESMRVRSCSAV